MEDAGIPEPSPATPVIAATMVGDAVPDGEIPIEVRAMVERTLGPGVSIGPAIPQPHPDSVVLPLTAYRRERES